MSNESGNKPVVPHKKHIARLQRERQQSRLILYIFFGILGVVLLLLGYGWLDLNYLQLQRPVAKVGNQTILVKDFEPRVRLQRQQLLNDYSQYLQYSQFFGMNVDTQLEQIASSLNSPVTIGQTVLDQMVNEEIIRQEAAKRGITVSEEELNKEIEEAFRYFPNGTPTPTVTPTTFVMPDIPAEAYAVVTVTPPATATPRSDATVEPTEVAPTPTIEPSATAGPSPTPFPTATPFTYEAFQKTLSDTDNDLSKLGFNKDYYRSYFEAQLLQRKLKEIITADVRSTETQAWARHILLKDSVTAADVINRLKNGGDFAELAKEFSIDTGSAVNGGDLGWFGPNVMVSEFEEAAFALEHPGDVTLEPVQSQFGYHIIQLVAKQERPLTADQLSLARDVEFQKWLNAVREEYGVEIYDIWKQRIPTEPNFITIATDSAISQLTAQAEALKQFEVTQMP